MELKSISIKNYRSVKDLTIDIKKTNGSFLQTLLGINESGKSNILKAIYEMSDKTAINYEQDCEKEARRRGESIRVSLVYELDELETGQLKELFSESKIAFHNQSDKITMVERSLTVTKNSEKINEWSPIMPSTEIKFVRAKEKNEVEGKDTSNEPEISFDELKTAIKRERQFS